MQYLYVFGNSHTYMGANGGSSRFQSKHDQRPARLQEKFIWIIGI